MALVAIVVGYVVLRIQDSLPLNPNGATPQSPDLAFNTSVSFETNTNWQNYSGETGVSYLSQMLILAVRNFTSAATGLAVAIALVRGLTRRSAKTLGNYWVDLTRGVLYILLPISIVVAVFLVWQGVPQTLNAPATATTLQGAQQTIALGPIASQEIIKELGNNGGGFLNANSAHPFENPTPLTNFVEMVAMFAITFSLTYTFGRYAGRPAPGLGDLRRDGGVFLVGAVSRCTTQTAGNPLFPSTVDQALGSMEGNETRFGSGVGALFASITTSTSTGAVISWHDSYQPIAGLVPLFNIELGEITPGGIGAGLYGMLVIGAILSVFIAGLMVGRTPEYLGKKVEAYEMKMAMVTVLVLGASILGFTALATVTTQGLAGPLNAGPARLQRDPLRVLQPDRQQRLGLRRPLREHALLQHHGRVRHAHRALRDDRADPGPGRIDGRQAASRRVPRHVPDDRRAVQRARHRRDRDRRRAHVLPGPVAGADRRAAPPERRKGLLRWPSCARSTSPAARAGSSASAGALPLPQAAPPPAPPARAGSSTRSCCGPPSRSRSASSIRST